MIIEIVFVLLAVYLFCYVIAGLIRGRAFIHVRLTRDTEWVYRTDSPLGYWSLIVGYFVFATWLLGFGTRELIDRAAGRNMDVPHRVREMLDER